MGNRTAAASLSNGHGREKDAHTEWRKDELIKGDSLHGRHKCATLGDGKEPFKQLEPSKLHRSHAKTVSHEPRKPLKVEGRRETLGIGNKFAVVEGILFVQLVDLNGKGIVLGDAAWLPERPFTHRGDGLRDGIGDTTKYRIGDHHGQDYAYNWSADALGTLVLMSSRGVGSWGRTWSFIVVRIESRRQPGNEGHFDEEDDGVE